MNVVTKCRECSATRAVKMNRIFDESVARSKVHASAKPPHGWCVGFLRNEKADVQVHDRRVRVARMQDERYAQRFPRAAGKLGAVRRRGCGHLLASNVRKQNAAALQYSAVFDETRDAATSFVARPRVTSERFAGNLLEAGNDTLLQIQKTGTRCGSIHAGRAVF